MNTSYYAAYKLHSICVIDSIGLRSIAVITVRVKARHVGHRFEEKVFVYQVF